MIFGSFRSLKAICKLKKFCNKKQQTKRFGYDENKIRIRPSYSGQKATCPLCQGTIIGKCGEIYVWHWQHNHDRECDPWQEHETDWHRKWKANFPDDWQEVILAKEGEKYIADVKTANGVVIEFQNSSISTSTIRIRENFYQEMIWVVNAKTFKDNFMIRSVVSSRLRNIGQNASQEISSLKSSYNDDLNAVTDDIEKNKKETTNRFNSINYKKGLVEKLSQHLEEHDVYTNTIIDKLSQDKSYWNYQTNEKTLK
ncbi:MAG: hypothetical protein H0X62_02855 [Bacteroidetes bacterium]|nr:hypothetical protein [Bacteroidota bacterium]